MRRLRWHGRGADGAIAELGYNSQLPTGSAAVLTEKLTLDTGWTQRRRAIAAAYDAALADGEQVVPIGVVAGRDSVRSKYAVRCPDRDALADALRADGIPTLIHYPIALPDHPLFGPEPSGGPWPRARAAAGEVLSLPIHAMLSDTEVERVSDGLRRFRRAYGSRTARPTSPDSRATPASPSRRWATSRTRRSGAAPRVGGEPPIAIAPNIPARSTAPMSDWIACGPSHAIHGRCRKPVGDSDLRLHRREDLLLAPRAGEVVLASGCRGSRASGRAPAPACR